MLQELLHICHDLLHHTMRMNFFFSIAHSILAFQICQKDTVRMVASLSVQEFNLSNIHCVAWTGTLYILEKPHLIFNSF